MKKLLMMILLMSPAISFAQEHGGGQFGSGGLGGEANQAEIESDMLKFSLNLHAKWDETGFEMLDRGIHTYEHLLSIDLPRAKELAAQLKKNLENLDIIEENKNSDALQIKGILQVVIFDEHSIKIEKSVWQRADDRQKNLISIHAIMNETPSTQGNYGNYALTMEIASLLAARGRK